MTHEEFLKAVEEVANRNVQALVMFKRTLDALVDRVTRLEALVLPKGNGHET